jgi:D-alanyl-D-alanine carboxypeptidase
MNNKKTHALEFIRLFNAATLSTALSFMGGNVNAENVPKPPKAPVKAVKKVQRSPVKALPVPKIKNASKIKSIVQKTPAEETQQQIEAYLSRHCGTVRPEREAYVAIDAKTGEILLQKDEDVVVQIASMTKMMTALLAFEAIEAGKISADTLVKIDTSWNRRAGGGTITNVLTYWEKPVPFMDLIEAAVIGSKNDAAETIAKTIGGSEAVFVQMMNARAKELGLKITFFNSHGLPQKDVDVLGEMVDAKEKGGVLLSVARLHKHINDKHPKLAEIMGRNAVELQGKSMGHTLSRLFKKLGEYLPTIGSWNAKSGTTCLSGSSGSLKVDDVILTVVGAKTPIQREKLVASLLPQARKEQSLRRLFPLQPDKVEPLTSSHDGLTLLPPITSSFLDISMFGSDVKPNISAPGSSPPAASSPASSPASAPETLEY